MSDRIIRSFFSDILSVQLICIRCEEDGQELQQMYFSFHKIHASYSHRDGNKMHLQKLEFERETEWMEEQKLRGNVIATMIF